MLGSIDRLYGMPSMRYQACEEKKFLKKGEGILSSNQQSLKSDGKIQMKAKVPVKVYNHHVIEQHPKD